MRREPWDDIPLRKRTKVTDVDEEGQLSESVNLFFNKKVVLGQSTPGTEYSQTAIDNLVLTSTMSKRSGPSSETQRADDAKDDVTKTMK